MSVFNPELGEFSESKFEQNKFDADVEAKLQKALEQGREKFPDIVQCPVISCANPVSVTMNEDTIELVCRHCGWTHVIHRAGKRSS